MAYTCVVKSCKNSSRKLKKWKKTNCDTHDVEHASDLCSCEPPFRYKSFINNPEYFHIQIRQSFTVNHYLCTIQVYLPCYFHVKFWYSLN